MTARPGSHPLLEVADVVPQARHVHPVELSPGDLLFDTAGALQPIKETGVFHEGKVVSALLGNKHRVWFWNDAPIIAVLPRTEAPTVTVYVRTFAPADEIGWANGDPRVINIEAEMFMWEPDDGNPIGWALRILDDHGALETSASPPFTERTWYSGSVIDFARSGATVDTSAHLSGFTRAEIEQVGVRVTARPPERRAAGSDRGASRPSYDASRAKLWAVGRRGR